ncbi:hypothetical protein ACYCJE_25845, partial [Klebsiella pneumoniae]
AEFTIGEGELMAHDVPLGCAPDEYDDLISGTCSHLPYEINAFFTFLYFYIKYSCLIFTCSAGKIHKQCWRRGGKRNNSSLGGRAGWR